MKIKNKTTETVITENYEIEDVQGFGALTYIDYLDKKGRVIDSVIRDRNGFDVCDGDILEQIQELIDSSLNS